MFNGIENNIDRSSKKNINIKNKNKKGEVI